MRGLRSGDLPTVLLAAALLIVSVVRFRQGDFRGGVSRVQRLCRPRPASALHVHESVVIGRTVRSVDAAAEWLPTSITCLPRSVVTSAIVQHRGVDARLCIGVRLDGRALRAHAWVQSRGRPINDDPSVISDFEPLFDESVTPAVLAAMG